MRWTALAVALCLSAAALPGCNANKAAGRSGTMASNERATTVQGTPLPAGMIHRVSVALHTGEQPKDPGDAVSVRLLRGSEVLGERTIGAGEAWPAGTMRAVEIPLEPAIPQEAARDLRLEVSTAGPAGGPGHPWTLQAEALGQLSEGRVVRLLEPTPGVLVGGENPFRRSWPLSTQ